MKVLFKLRLPAVLAAILWCGAALAAEGELTLSVVPQFPALEIHRTWTPIAKAIEGAVLLMETLEKLPGVKYEIVAFDSTARVIKSYGERTTHRASEAIIDITQTGHLAAGHDDDFPGAGQVHHAQDGFLEARAVTDQLEELLRAVGPRRRPEARA